MSRRWLMDEWRDAFVTELRLRQVPGTQIGEALAEVDAHCTDSGQSPAEAFGDPVDYAAARAADLEKLPPARHGSMFRAAWLAAAGVAGVYGVLSGAIAVDRGTPGEISLGGLVLIALAPPLTAAVVTLVMRPGLSHRTLRLAAAFTLCLAGPLVPALLWPQVVLRLPAPAMLVAGVLLLAVAWWRLMSGSALGDRIVDPRSGREPFRLSPWIGIVIRFGPIMLLLATAVVFVLVL